MKLKLFNAFLILMGVLLSKPIFGDPPPPLQDGNCDPGKNCDSGSANGRDYFVKLKYLDDISSRVSLSEFRRISRSRYEASSERFCAIAYSCKSGDKCNRRNNRTMHDYQINFTGPTDGGPFVLTSRNDSIPITLRLRGVVLDATDGIDKEMFKNHPVDVPGNNSGSYEYCINNEFVIVAEIAADDLKHATGEIYRGKFDATVNPVDFPSEVQSLDAKSTLNIDLKLPPFLLISGLEDMQLDHTVNSGISKTQDFCVYVSGGKKFEIKAESEVGKRSFQLSKGTLGNTIRYKVAVGKDGRLEVLTEGEYTRRSWEGAEELFCDGKGNMKIALTIEESEVIGKPPGTYKDTLYLTVKPAS